MPRDMVPRPRFRDPQSGGGARHESYLEGETKALHPKLNRRRHGEAPRGGLDEMVLEMQKLSFHNGMLGRLQKSPAKASKAQHTSDRPAKRPRLAKDDTTVNEDDDDDLDSPRRVPSPKPVLRTIIPDSDAESDDGALDDDDEPPSTQPTAVEQSAPPIRTDKVAIDEYEAMRAAESELPSDIRERLGQRQWVKGKSSIYVDAFNLALETVLEEESHLFDVAEMKVFQDWRELGYEAQYLYVRLFLRKTSAWHRINRLGYYSDIADMDAAVKELYVTRHLPSRSEEAQISPGELGPPEGTELGESFTFADCSEDHITTLEEASTLLLLDELKVIAKEARVQGKNKTELLKALRRTSGKQSGLGFATLQRTDTEESVQSNTSETTREESLGTNRDAHFTRKILAETGPCIRLSLATYKLFERVHLVFYRSTEWTDKSLTTIILARIARRNFPDYIVSRSANIFPSRALLLEFEAAIRTQFRVDNILEFNGPPSKEGFQVILDIFDAVVPRWRVLLAEEQRKEDSIYLSSEGAYLRRLSPAWIYTRIVHKGAYVLGLGKFKQHAREHAILSELLTQRLFHASRRGVWYQRKALLEEHYMAALTPAAGRSPEDQKKHWKRVALQTCERGLQDNLVHLIYHYDLQKRVTKLERALRVPKRLQHEFGHAMLAKPAERTVYGVRVEKHVPAPTTSTTPALLRRSSTASTTPAQTTPTAATAPRRSTKTIWLDPLEGAGECSVEAMCLSHYRTLGYKGFHTEGGLVRTLFALLFYDVLFTYIPHVFQTPYQACPLDLHAGDGAFCVARSAEVNRRLADIANGGAAAIVREVWEREWERRTCVVGLDWGFEVGDLVEIVKAFGGEKLATVCKVMAQEYAERGGGMPDLFLWRGLEAEDGTGAGGDGDANGSLLDEEAARQREEKPLKGEVLFAEVKSVNDRLSDTQRLWIHVLTGAGIKVELCHALEKEVVYR